MLKRVRRLSTAVILLVLAVCALSLAGCPAGTDGTGDNDHTGVFIPSK